MYKQDYDTPDWQALVEHYHIYERQRYELNRIEAAYAKSSDAMEMIRGELKKPRNTDKSLALEVLRFMSHEDMKSVFPEVFSVLDFNAVLSIVDYAV